MTATETEPDVLAVREEYEARILGLHMPATVRQAAEKYGDAAGLLRQVRRARGRDVVDDHAGPRRGT